MRKFFEKSVPVTIAMIGLSFNLMCSSIKSVGKHLRIYHKQLYSGDTRLVNRKGLFCVSWP